MTPQGQISAFFFYGTLCRGQRNFPHAAGALRVVEGKVRGELYDTPWGYPAAFLGEEGWVWGELHEYAPAELPERLAALDALEEFFPGRPEESEYLRVPVWVETPTLRVQAWSYTWPPAEQAPLLAAGARRICGGRWPV